LKEFNMAKATKAQSLTQALRQAIQDSEQSLYAVAKGSDVDYATLTRFLSGERDMRLGNASKVAEYLGFHLVKKRH
jgi:hypothetical protein